MTVSGGSDSVQESGTVVAWEPARMLHSVSEPEVRYARGFLRCRPEKWFPAFATHWLPLTHSLGVEARVSEVRPLLTAPKGEDNAYVCSVDGEYISLSFDENSLSTALEAVAPGGVPAARGIVADYLARRLLLSVLTSWSGPENSVIKYEPESELSRLNPVSYVKLVVSINESPCTMYFGLSRSLTDRMDGLWRRQLRSSARGNNNSNQVISFEVAQLAVPPTMLVDYLRTGSIVDLEIPVSDQIVLKIDGKPWASARLFNFDGKFCAEVQSSAVGGASVPEGTTRLSVVLGQAAVEHGMLSEIMQPGAMWDLGIELTNKVLLQVNGEQVGDARLGAFEGRFAITVS